MFQSVKSFIWNPKKPVMSLLEDIAIVLAVALAFASFSSPAHAASPRMNVFSATWNAASIADGDKESKDVAAPGAAIGDACIGSMGVDVVDLGVSCAITAANVATVTLLNNTGGAVDLASTTVRAFIVPQLQH